MEAEDEMVETGCAGTGFGKNGSDVKFKVDGTDCSGSEVPR